MNPSLKASLKRASKRLAALEELAISNQQNPDIQQMVEKYPDVFLHVSALLKAGASHTEIHRLLDGVLKAKQVSSSQPAFVVPVGENKLTSLESVKWVATT